MQHPPPTQTRITAAAAALALGACCTQNIVLRRPPANDNGALGPYQRCEASEKPCRDDPVYDSSRGNASHTAFVRLPDCAFGIEEIIVQHAESSDAVALVRCAAPPPTPPSSSGGLPTTAPGGGTTPAP